MCVHVCMHMYAWAQAHSSVTRVHYVDQLVEVHEPQRINNSSSKSSRSWLNISFVENIGELEIPILHIWSPLHILYVHSTLSTLKCIGLFSHPHLSLARISDFAQEETDTERVVISCKHSAQLKADLSPSLHFTSSPLPFPAWHLGWCATRQSTLRIRASALSLELGRSNSL